MTKDQVMGIYLAAGQSKRMGQNKLALLWQGKPLGVYGLQAAIKSRLDCVIVILNRQLDNSWINAWKGHKKIRLLDCPWADKGQAASIQCGLEEAIKADAGSAMILLADMPFIESDIINNLIAIRILAHNEYRPFDYISCKIDSVIYPPVLFNHSAFPDLSRLKGDIGARKMLNRHSMRGIHLDWPSGSVFSDVDTMEDFRNLPNKPKEL